MKIPDGLLLSLFLVVALAKQPGKRHYDTHRYYALEHVPKPNGASLDEIANTLGVEVVEQAGELKNTWLVRRIKPTIGLERREEDDSVLATYSKLQELADSPLQPRSGGARKIVSSIAYLELQELQELAKRAPPTVYRTKYPSAGAVLDRFKITDPLFLEQWHLVNDEYPENQLNVTPVWEMGYTGKGIRTSFLDDGIDFDTEDLKDAFDAKNSYDFNAHVPLPRPTGARDHHGTRCAGQVTARKNKSCGVGIAYDAMAAGVRILGGRITTVDEAAALNYGYDEVDLYSCSWGPRDNGQTMEGPNYLIRKAVVNGIQNGRQGKGSIFVFASGNGGRNGDQCNFDGYTNSIYSITVGSVDYKGLHPSYSEACSANMIVAYSSGSGQNIVTTDRNNECSMTHGGTSAAAPNVVGVLALALQARPDLTWRDMQHLCVETARKINLGDPDWQKNGAGKLYSYKYGFGAIDAYSFVEAAKTWKLVKPQAWVQSQTVRLNNGKITKVSKKIYTYEGGVRIPKGGIKNTIEITKQHLVANNFDTLEHIDVRVWIEHSRRGDVEVSITSPQGTTSILAAPRDRDDAKTGFPGWRFMSIKHWGENPIGKWTIRVEDQALSMEGGSFLGWDLKIWGSVVDPAQAKHWVEPVNDNFLPPDPTRPDSHDSDPTSKTLHSKPTDLLPPDHGNAEGDNHRPAFPKPGSSEDDDDDWFIDLTSGNKWFLYATGFVFIGLIGGLLVYWRRRSRQRRARYQALSTGEGIRLDTMVDDDVLRGGTRTTRDLYNSFGQPSQEVIPSAVEPPHARDLGFHSGFLDDDEPSAGITPKYRDEPVEEEDGDDDDDEDEEDEDDEDEDEDDEDDEDDESDTGHPAHAPPRPGGGSVPSATRPRF